MTQTSLNTFQRLQRLWDTVHPYNAAQILKIAGQPDIDRMHRAWIDTLSALRLGPVVVEGKSFRFEPTNGHTPREPVQIVKQNLHDFISDEMNKPFDDPHAAPFRPFVIVEDDWHYLGVVYQHWVADSVSIRLLMREWFARLHDPYTANGHTIRLHDQPYNNLLGPSRGRWDWFDRAMALNRRHSRFRQVMKVEARGMKDPRERFLLKPAEPGLIDQLRDVGRQRNLKLGDVFLAATMEACHRHVPTQVRCKRRDLAIGNIVDLRPYCDGDLSHTFGLYLGFTDIIARPCDLEDFDRLIRIVSSQTRDQKRKRAAAASTLWMNAALFMSRISAPHRMAHMYRKEFPLAGGISNVDVTHTWMTQYHPKTILDHIRVSPTGPLVPLAITTTTLADQFHIGLTYRNSLIDDQRTDQIASTILHRLASIA